MLDESTLQNQSDATHAMAPQRYTLGRSLRIVRAMETSVTRTAVFEEIKAKNRIVRIVDGCYARADARLTRRFILALYMLKSVSSLGPEPQRSAQALSIAGFANEVHAIDRIVGLLPEVVEVAGLRIKRSNLFAKGQGRALLRTLGLIAARWRFLGRLARQEDFMPACRIASALAAFARFETMLEIAPQARIAIVASNYSPDAVGLAAAAHKAGRDVVYVNHAPVPQNSPYVPPVFADYAFFNGSAIHNTYRTRSTCQAAPVLIGQEGSTLPMAWSKSVRTVGIFLTALTRVSALTRLVREIRQTDPNVQILIRHHPVALLKTDLSQLESETPGLRVTIGTPLENDIADCDVVICGNSGVILNTLRAGRPAAYLPELDELPLDYNGFLEGGLVPLLDGWDATSYEKLRAFYDQPQWNKVMLRFDASYLRESGALEQEARQTLLRLLSPQSEIISVSRGVPRVTSREAVLPSMSS